MWTPVARAMDVQPGTARVVSVEGQAIALVCTPEGLFAVDNTCPHSGGPLGEGVVQGPALACPWHGWQFDYKSGACLTENRPNLVKYPIKIEQDQIWIETNGARPAPGPETTPEGEWVAAGLLENMSPGTVRKIPFGDRAIALICSTDGVYALDNACAHEGGALGEGSVEGRTVTCPLHGWRFDGKTGQCLTEAKYRQRTFETKIDQGKIWVRMAPAPPATEAPTDPSAKKSAVEAWKTAKHGLDVWPDVLHYAQEGTPMAKIEEADLERMKWYGYLYRKNNDNNHYMCRVRIPGCEMTAEQARVLAYIAYQSGYSLLDVTTRGNIQIQGLTIDKLPWVRSVLEQVGLTARQSAHDNVRNITSHPYSGIDPEELIDTRELARQIQAMIVGHREFSDLPRKFNIALCGRPEAAGHAWTQDLSYIAMRGPEQCVGFQWLLGGSQGQSPKMAWHIPVFVRPEQVLGVTAAVVRTFRELGYRHNRHQVRFRYLIERLGPDAVLSEVEKRLGYALDPFPAPPARPAAREDFTGWFAQKQEGLWAVGICVPVGRLTYDQMEGLASIAQNFGRGTLRTTYDQNLIITNVPAEQRRSVGYAIARHGLTYEPDPVTRNLVSCTGKQFCNIAVTETKGYTYQIIEELRRRKVQLHDIRINMSGCPSSCGNSYTSDIGLKGVKVRRQDRVLDAFDVYLGGGLAEEAQMGILYEKGVPFQHLPELLENIIQEFYQRRSEAETFSQYWRKKLADHKAKVAAAEIPTWQCSHCEYRVVTQDPPPFCPICAALRAKFEPVEESDGNLEKDKESRLAAPAAVSEPASPPLWVCQSCGLKHTGEAPPEFCPVCAVKKTDFQRAAGAPKANRTPVIQPKPKGRMVLIVGGSIAGHTAAQTARALDPQAQITIVTEERHAFYNRLNLTRYLAEEVQRHELFDYTPGWYEEHRIETLTGSCVIGVDPIKKTALLQEGRELSYDACILAHGSSAVTPTFYRPDLPGVFLLRTLQDVEGIIERARPGASVAIIGGGVLGLEAAWGVVKRGAAARVFEFLPRLMPRQLDEAGATLFREMVWEKGIEPHTGVAVKELLGKERVEGLELSDGRRFPADLVIVSTGIRPNIDWVKRSGIHCRRGVLVNDRMQTNAEGVFSAGDVAEWRGQVVGLWTNAIEQAKVAATNAVGQMGYFQGFLPVTILKCLGIPLVSIGDIREDSEAVTSDTQREGSRTYRRLISHQGIPVGAILLGTTSGMGDMRRLIEVGIELNRVRQRVVPEFFTSQGPGPSLAAAPG